MKIHTGKRRTSLVIFTLLLIASFLPKQTESYISDTYSSCKPSGIPIFCDAPGTMRTISQSTQIGHGIPFMYVVTSREATVNKRYDVHKAWEIQWINTIINLIVVTAASLILSTLYLWLKSNFVH